jgi:hypothetical protein
MGGGTLRSGRSPSAKPEGPAPSPPRSADAPARPGQAARRRPAAINRPGLRRWWQSPTPSGSPSPARPAPRARPATGCAPGRGAGQGRDRRDSRRERPARDRLGHRSVQFVPDLGIHGAQHGLEQPRLVAEMVVQRAARHPASAASASSETSAKPCVAKARRAVAISGGGQFLRRFGAVGRLGSVVDIRPVCKLGISHTDRM